LRIDRWGSPRLLAPDGPSSRIPSFYFTPHRRVATRRRARCCWDLVDPGGEVQRAMGRGRRWLCAYRFSHGVTVPAAAKSSCAEPSALHHRNLPLQRSFCGTFVIVPDTSTSAGDGSLQQEILVGCGPLFILRRALATTAYCIHYCVRKYFLASAMLGYALKNLAVYYVLDTFPGPSQASSAIYLTILGQPRHRTRPRFLQA
jgi:hypothetical protein